jgi:prolipoprotein diacylglyceryltransferase
METHGLRVPSSSLGALHLGAAFIYLYALMCVAGIALAIYVARRRAAAGR